MACGHNLAAVRSGIAEWTPNFRAAYDAADTTPRSFRCPPTTTGLPFSDGSNSSSTDTKKASMSTWKIVRCGVILRDCSAELQLGCSAGLQTHPDLQSPKNGRGP